MSVRKKKIQHIQTNASQLYLACTKVPAVHKLDYFNTGDIVFIRSDSDYAPQQKKDAGWYSGVITKRDVESEADHPYWIRFGNGNGNCYNAKDLIHARFVVNDELKNQDLSFLLKKTL